MTANFSDVELDITKEIVNIGLSKSADSLSFFIKEKVLINLVDLKINSGDYRPLSKKVHSDKCYLLTTEIKGELKGKAFLIFSETEVESIINANLPESIRNNPVEKASMTNAFLLEIDNIITASVVTQFANILHCKIFGDVPSLNILPHDQLNQFLGEIDSKNFNSIYFNSKFDSKSISMNPEFIWLLDDKFFSGVKGLVSDEKKQELIHSLNNNL
jgi:chemotaxis protein CheY-P-specific phosphatase CheC